MIEAQEETIRSMLSGGDFVLIGAGQLGEMAIDQWPKSVPKPRLFLDSSRTGSCRGIPIQRLQDFQPNSTSTFLLSAFKMPAGDVDAIFKRLGQSLILTVYDLFEEYSSNLFSNGWRCLD